jgi:hypothetical protein
VAWQSITAWNNTVGDLVGNYGGASGFPLCVTGPGDPPNCNVLLNGKPATNKIVVRRNEYDNRRLHVIAYNWEQRDSISLNLAGFVPSGANYRVFNVQNFFANAVSSGVYQGTPININVTNLTPAQPIGGDGYIQSSEYTGREFNAFIIVIDAPAAETPRPPTNLRLQ